MFGPVGVLLLTYVVTEIVVIVGVAKLIGVLPVLLLVAMSSLVGVVFVRYQAVRMVSNTLATAVKRQRFDSAPLVDGTTNLLVGVLLILPGFVSTAFGALLLLPPVRRMVRPFAFARASTWTGFTKRFGTEVVDVTLVDDLPPKPSQSTRHELG